MKILIDTYGADQGEKVLVDGAIACQKRKTLHLFLSEIRKNRRINSW